MPLDDVLGVRQRHPLVDERGVGVRTGAAEPLDEVLEFHVRVA